VALPILVISGYIMVFTRAKAKVEVKPPSLLVESMGAVSGLLGDFGDAMDGVSNDLARINRKNELQKQRTEKERAAEGQLRLRRVEWDVHLRYANSEEEKLRARTELAAVDEQLATLREAMRAIEKQCEIDAIQELHARLSKT
jgi:hypothetical protein